MTGNNKTRGYIFALLAVTIFAAQDGFTKFLGDRYSPILVTMFRFWAFAVFVTLLATASPGGILRVARTQHPFLQVVRGLLLVFEIVVVVFAFRYVGLAMSQSILQATPLLVTVLSVPLLGEQVGWRRATAVIVGLFGVLVIINPVGVRFETSLLLPLASAFMFALYSVATRAVSYRDSAITSTFYAAVVGAIAISALGPFYWTTIHLSDWPALVALCVCGTLSHYCLIRAYGLLAAVEVQPITYLQLVLSALVAVTFFGERLSVNMVIGAAIVVGAGLFTVWREHRLATQRWMKQSTSKQRAATSMLE
jgi:drug/metabolite transporter (DMT)-like permease